MPSTTTAVFAAAFTLFSSVLAFSPDQCNATYYGAPSQAACSSLLTKISNIGGNTTYLFIPAQFATPAGLSNGTRVNFPVIWSTPGCKAALVPIEVTNTTVTYDTSSYPDLALSGQSVLKNCISNSTVSGGWELAGDNENLVIHLFASGSQIDQTVEQQTSTSIATTTEDQIDEAELDDPDYSTGDAGGDIFGDDGGDIFGDGDGDGGNSTQVSGTTIQTSIRATTTAAAPKVTTTAAVSASVPTVAASVVQHVGTFDYYGCSLDSSTSRTLSSLTWAGTALTVQRCAAYCSAYKYMGVEFGSECYCGGDANGKGIKSSTIVTHDPTNCTTPCNGALTQLCGGVGWLSLYQSNISPSAGATA